MFRKFAILALAAAASLAFSGAAHAFKLGIIAFQMSAETHARVANAAAEAAKKLGWQVQVLNSEGSLPKHAEQIEAMIRFEQNVASRIRGKILDVILSENPAVKVLGSHSMARTASWRDDVRNGMQALILQNKGKFQGVWASWAGQAWIIDDILRAQGIKKGEVFMVSVDGGQESYRRIKDPESLFTATVMIPFETIGEKAVDAMDKIAAKKMPKEKVVDGPYMWVDAVLVDATNVDQFLAK